MELRTMPHWFHQTRSVGQSVSQPAPDAIPGISRNKDEYDKALSSQRSASWERQIIKPTRTPWSPGYTRFWEDRMTCQIFSAKIFILIIRWIHTPASKGCLGKHGEVCVHWPSIKYLQRKECKHAGGLLRLRAAQQGALAPTQASGLRG